MGWLVEPRERLERAGVPALAPEAGTALLARALGSRLPTLVALAFEPAAEAAKAAASEANGSVAGVFRAAAEAAKEGAEATIPLVARKGRASYLGPRSAGHQDPGATSTYYLLDAAARSLEGSS